MEPLTLRPRLAIVVQRYGLEVNGGAETAARVLAEHLTALAEVHVLTTCAVDYTTWADVYPPGESDLNGVRVHRFRVDSPRRWGRSQKAAGRLLLKRDRTVEEELDWLRAEGPFSTPLLHTIRRSAESFNLFFFFTYLYATTVFGLPLVADKAVLIPTAHDEPFLYLAALRALFHLPRYLVYLTAAEQAIVQRVTGNANRPSDVIPIGITAPPTGDPARFRQRYGIEGDFLLYAGRISEAKNVGELLAFFRRYRQETQRPLKLVLIGQADSPLPAESDILPLGFLPEGDKFDAYSAAALLVLPSRFESLSIVILEAWLMGAPVVVNAACAVTKEQVRRSHGGLHYASYEEFAAEVTLLLDSVALRHALARQGRRFVELHYTWEVVVPRYAALLHDLLGVKKEQD